MYVNFCVDMARVGGRFHIIPKQEEDEGESIIKSIFNQKVDPIFVHHLTLQLHCSPIKWQQQQSYVRLYELVNAFFNALLHSRWL